MRQIQYFGWLMLMMVTLSGAMCKGINPLAQAETTEQRAYAAYGTYVIFAEKAADVAERLQATQPRVVLQLIEIEDAASPVADDLLEAILELESIRAEIAAGESREDQLRIALQNLNAYANRLIPLTNELIKQIRGAE